MEIINAAFMWLMVLILPATVMPMEQKDRVGIVSMLSKGVIIIALSYTIIAIGKVVGLWT